MIQELAKKLDFPQEAIDTLVPICRSLHENAAVCDRLYHTMDLFFEGSEEVYPLLDSIANDTGIRRESVDMVFLLLAARPLRYLYRQKGLPDDLYYDTLADLRYKLIECKKNRDVWGSFVTWWYPRFYNLTLFKLGRLQYEPRSFSHEDYKGIIKQGDTVYNCHIPSAGALRPEDVIDSLKRAHAFYRNELKNGILPVYCSSWMLYPGHRDLFPEGSNLRRFYDLFDILDSRVSESNADFWRIFDMPYSPETLKDAPADSGLRRRLKDYLLAGNQMGSGQGILLFDGERVLK